MLTNYPVNIQNIEHESYHLRCDYRLILIPDSLDNHLLQIFSLFLYPKSQTIAQANG